MQSSSVMALDLSKEADELVQICPGLVDKIIRSAITFTPFPKIPDIIESISVEFSSAHEVKVNIVSENIILYFDEFDVYGIGMISKRCSYLVEINTSVKPGDYAWSIIKDLQTNEIEELKDSCDCYNSEELLARTLAGDRVVCIGSTKILRHLEMLSFKLVGHQYLGLYTTYESHFFSATIRKAFHKLFRKNHKVKIC